MDPASIVAIIEAASQLVQIALKEKALLSSADQATVNSALASLRATSDQMYADAVKL